MLGLTCDNASNNDSMVDALADDDDIPSFPGKGHQVRCLAHVLNLASKAFLSPFDSRSKKRSVKDFSLDGDGEEDVPDLVDASDDEEGDDHDGDEGDDDVDDDGSDNDDDGDDDDMTDCYATTNSLPPRSAASLSRSRIRRQFTCRAGSR